jgi:hypothetical protein
MTNLIKKIDTNHESENAYILVVLNDDREIIVQCDLETNRLHADFGANTVWIFENACDENDNLSSEEKKEILEELKFKFKEEVKEFEEFCDNLIN